MRKVSKMFHMPPRPGLAELKRSLILPDEMEESASMAKIQRWLEMADLALKNKPTSDQKRSA